MYNMIYQIKSISKYKKDIFYIVLLIIGIFLFINHSNKLESKFNNYENTISALNDSIHIVKKGNIIEYSKKTPEINIDDLINSEYFKTLSNDQQAFYNQLKSIKGLVSATNATLESHSEILSTISDKQNPGTIKDDSIRFKLGTVLNFKQLDTTKHLKWKANVSLNKEIDFKFDYTYKVNVLTTYERQKDKSIIVKYSIDDPELKVSNMNNFIIPVESNKRTKLGKFIEKNKKPLLIISSIGIFGFGGYIGYSINK